MSVLCPWLCCPILIQREVCIADESTHENINNFVILIHVRCRRVNSISKIEDLKTARPSIFECSETVALLIQVYNYLTILCLLI